MGSIRVFKKRLTYLLHHQSGMDARPPREPSDGIPARGQSGIALFMVIAAISVLAILVTEFTYIAQLNQKLAFDGLDQLKAHYLAKSGLKLSLLRLKAYKTIKGISGATGGGGNTGANPPAGGGSGGGIPRQILDKIWSFPFFYPIPTIPGMSLGDKEAIENFQKESGFDGSFSAVIESESAKYNLNMILAAFAPKASPSPSATASGTPPPPPPNPNATASPSPTPTFNPEEARKSLAEYITGAFTKKAEEDQDFASEYRDFKVEDLVDAIVAWADPSYERKNQTVAREQVMKKAPFYSLSELHMVPGMDEDVYNLLAPSMTVSTTPGLNVNTMKEETLKALLPQMKQEEITEFFKYRDNEEEDNSFKSEDDFFKYLQNSVTAFSGNAQAVQQFKESLTKRNIRIVTDEEAFKITVLAKVNQSSRKIEAWVLLTGKKKDDKKTGTGTNPGAPPPSGGSPNPAPSQPQGTDGAENRPDPGLRITFMRTL